MIKPPLLQEYDEKENLILVTVTAGYHTKFRSPDLAHPTRESASYAIRCLASDQEADHVIGRKILEKLLALQVTDPTDKHYGIWGWYAEEPPDQMAPADWNWADFMGVRLLQILHDHNDRLSPDLAGRIREAVERTAWSIFRRNVGPGYTNICAMGAVVCITAGEMFPNALLLDYGVRRLRNMRRELEFHGGFPEYNSPTYTAVVLEELERLLYLAKHAEARENAQAILDHTWKLIADQFHPATGQWAGPQSRSYQNWLDLEKVLFLEKRLGRELLHRPPAEVTPELVDPHHAVPCPANVRDRFLKLPESPYQYRHCWVKRPDGTPAQVSTTWFSDDATLGSMDAENTWDQRRVILGYWRTPDGQVVRLRLRLMHNGHDFVSGFTRNQQENSRVLTGFHFTAGNGDFHPYFDRPAKGIFTTQDLRIRYEVEGPGVTLQQLAPDLFEIRAGMYKVVIRTGSIRFGGVSQSWISGQEKNLAWVDGIFYSGPERPFHPGEIGECTAAAALELLPVGETPSSHPLAESTSGSERTFSWKAGTDFSVGVPLVAPKIE